METLKSIENICNGFREGKFNIEEFQSRLQSLMVEDELKQHLKNILNTADNRLEEIRFCSLESNFYQHGLAVADYLVEKIKDII